MDKRQKQDFGWLPAQMPGVAELLKARRVRDGAAHVNECWRRGVVGCEPGWFYAREGALAVGMPDPTWLHWPELQGVPGAASAPMLVMREPQAQAPAQGSA